MMKVAAFFFAFGSLLALSPSVDAANNLKRVDRELDKGDKKSCGFNLDDSLYAEALDLFAWGARRRNLAAGSDVERRANYNAEEILTAWAPLYTVDDETCIYPGPTRKLESSDHQHRLSGRNLDSSDEDECDEPVQVGFVTYDCAFFDVGDFASCDFNFICMDIESALEVLGTVTSTGITGFLYPFDVDPSESEAIPFGEMAITGGTKEFNKKKTGGQVRVDYLIANTIRFTFDD